MCHIPLVAKPTSAQDWPQILGTNRNGQVAQGAASSSQQFSPEAWPSELKPVWSAPIGSGYGGPAIVGDRVYMMHREGDTEIISAFSFADGSEAWRASWKSDFQPSINYDNGPRCGPVIADGMAYCYGAAGTLACVRIDDGKLLWERPLRKEFEADDGWFGAGSTPLVVSDRVIVNIGAEEAGIIALDVKTGETRWKATAYDASYASPILARQTNGGTRLLVITRLNTVLLDASTGIVLDEIRFGSRGPTVNGALPVAVADGKYLLTASYNVGATLVEISDNQLTEVFKGSDLLLSQYNTPVWIGDRLIGINGREDVGVAALRAIDLDDQSVLWEQTNFGVAHLLAFGTQVLALGLDGKLTLIDGSAKEFTPLAVTQLPTRGSIYRAIPAFRGKSLLVRDSMSNYGSGARLMRFDLP